MATPWAMLWASWAALSLTGRLAVSAAPAPQAEAEAEAEARALPGALAADDECLGGGASNPACDVNLLQMRGRTQRAGAADALAGAQGRRNGSKFFVWLSDIHADPYYGTERQQCTQSAAKAAANEFGTMRCDPPFSLFDSAVAHASQVGRGAELLVFTGDFARHDQSQMPDPWMNVTGIVANITHKLNEGFRWIDARRKIVGTQGNDDSPKNYEVNVTTNSSTNPWFANLADRFYVGSAMPPERVSEYAYGGFFEAEFGAITILSISTVMYSNRHTPKEPIEKDPFGQFAWLRRCLENAAQRGRSVWIVGHIPPGIETFAYTPLWMPLYVEAYLELVQDPVLGNIIAAQLFGHVHADEFRLLPNAPAGAGPVLLTGALSPVFNSNPSFRLVEYDAESGRLLGVQVYWAKLTTGGEPLQWEFGYELTQAYAPLRKAVESSGGLTNAAFKSLAAQLDESWAGNGAMFSTYAEWYKTRVQNDLQCCALQAAACDCDVSTETKVKYMGKYRCALMVATEEDFVKCAKPHTVRPVSLPQSAADYPTEHEYWTAARLAHWSSIVGLEDQELLKPGKPCSRMAEVADA